MKLSVTVRIGQDDVWSITYDAQTNLPIKGTTIYSKEQIKKVKKALDIAQIQLQGQFLLTNDID